jgi:hypothetical protein
MSIVFLLPLSDSVYPAKTASFTATAGSTGTWPAAPAGVMVWADQACYVAVGEGVTATTSSTPIPANTPIPFTVPTGTGGAWRVSALQVSTGGTVYAKPLNQ